MGFDVITPRQLVPSVGMTGVGSTGLAASSTASSTSSPTRNSPDLRKPYTLGTFDFVPHSEFAQPTFAEIHSGMDLTFGDFGFLVNQWGTLHVSSPPRASRSEVAIASTPDFVNSSSSSTPDAIDSASSPTPSIIDSSAEGSDVSYDCSDCAVFHVAAILRGINSSSSDDCSSHDEGRNMRNRHPSQVFMAGPTATPGGQSTPRRRTAPRPPIQYPITVRLQDDTELAITQEMTDKVSDVINNGTTMPADSSREDTLAYQYMLCQKNLELLELQQQLEERQQRADSDNARRAAASSSFSTRGDLGTAEYQRYRARMTANGPRPDIRPTNMRQRFMTIDDDGIPVPQTTVAAIQSVATYLHSTMPPPDDPRAPLHRA